MDDHNQIFIPPSFVALYQTRPHGPVGLPEAQLRTRYETCEDLACQLVEQAQALYQADPSEQGILAAMHTGLAAAQSGLSGAEARWVTLRLAELLQWRCPELTA